MQTEAHSVLHQFVRSCVQIFPNGADLQRNFPCGPTGLIQRAHSSTGFTQAAKILRSSAHPNWLKETVLQACNNEKHIAETGCVPPL